MYYCRTSSDHETWPLHDRVLLHGAINQQASSHGSTISSSALTCGGRHKARSRARQLRTERGSRACLLQWKKRQQWLHHYILMSSLSLSRLITIPQCSRAAPNARVNRGYRRHRPRQATRPPWPSVSARSTVHHGYGLSRGQVHPTALACCVSPPLTPRGGRGKPLHTTTSSTRSTAAPPLLVRTYQITPQPR
jgi:hypothetical protein